MTVPQPPPTTDQHELLVTYEGPFHPSSSSFTAGKSRKSFCFRLPSSKLAADGHVCDDDDSPPSCFVSEQDVLASLAVETGWPSSMLCIATANNGNISSPSLLFPSSSLQLNHHRATIHRHTLTARLHPRHTSLLGGKGGFGTLLKGQSKQAGAKTTLDFGACRDLSGRRLRHVNDEIKLRKFRSLQASRERGEKVDELAALKSESGIRNWHLMVPNWSEGALMSQKGRRKADRQLEREVKGWQSKEERAQRLKEQKRMDEEWAVMEYVRRGEVEGARVATGGSGGDVKEGILAHLRKKKEEKRLLESVAKGESNAGDDRNDVAAAVVPNIVEDNFASSTVSSHLMTLAGEMSVFDIPDTTEQSTKQPSKLRLHSQSDFATAVVLLDAAKVSSSGKKSKGVYIEYTVQTGGLAQVGWIRTPDAFAGDNASDASSFLPNSDTGDGVGDDTASFGYDGSRGLKFHGGKESAYGQVENQQSLEWKSGDVLGCWCRLSDGSCVEIGYSLNGVDLDTAFSPSTKSDSIFGYYPAVSLNLGEVMDVNVGPDFSFGIKDGCVGAFDLIKEETDVGDAEESEPSTKLYMDNTQDDEKETNSPPKKKMREDSSNSNEAGNVKTEVETFDLNECSSVDELKEMNPDRLKSILLSMGVKCG